MYPILEKRLLAEGIWLMKVLAPRVARSAQPGQFVIVRVDEHGERIPLTISDFDAAEGSVTIVTQAIGASTRKICALNEGDALADFAGPLGHPSEFVKMPVEELRKRRYLFVAGGVGTAPVYPQVKWLREHGVKADVIIGAKTRDMLIYTDAMRAVAENRFVECEEVYVGTCYGTLRSEVERIWAKGHVIVFDVDVVGGINLKRIFGDDACSVFIMPPSVEELRRRLEGRGTDAPEVIDRRVAKAEFELTKAPEFDHVVVNDCLDEAVCGTCSILDQFIAR